jgi:hypothetical protein
MIRWLIEKSCKSCPKKEANPRKLSQQHPTLIRAVRGLPKTTIQFSHFLLKLMFSPSHTLCWCGFPVKSNICILSLILIFCITTNMPPQKSSPRPKKATSTAKPKGAVRAKSGCYTCRIRRKVCNLNAHAWSHSYLWWIEMWRETYWRWRTLRNLLPTQAGMSRFRC